MRYLPLTDADRRAMLETVGVASIDALFAEVPEAARLDGPIAGLPLHQSEIAVERRLARLAAMNVPAGSVPSFLGAGAYRHHIPAAVDHLVQRGEFLTSYTPYQPEITQGTLQALFEFQSQVALLTGMEVANASLYDGATAVAEAVLMARRVTGRSDAVLSGALHPHYAEVVDTYAGLLDFTATRGAPDPLGAEDLAAQLSPGTAAVVVQYPDVFGHVRDLTALAEAVHAAGALLIVAVTEIVALGALVPPGAMGADIVAGEGQSLGNALNFGGPYVGLFAARQAHLRQMPGRLCGRSVDADGRPGFVLTLSTREQHIRREKATSNICTNSGLCALAFTIHLTLLGETGLRQLALLNHAAACRTAERLAQIPGVTVLNDAFFNEVTLRLPRPAAKLVEALAGAGVLAGVPASRLFGTDNGVDDLLIVAATELTTDVDIAQLAAALEEELA